MSDIIVGLDVASTSARACLLQVSTGTVLLERNVPATIAGEDELLASLPSDTPIVMESTGRFHLTWARRLHQAGHRVFVLNALLAKRLATTVNALRQHKTDAIDARHLAEVGQLHLAKLQRYRFVPEDPARVRLRTLCLVRRNQRFALTNAVRTAQHLLAVMLPESPFIGLNLAYNQGLAELFLKIDSLRRLQRMRPTTLAEYACSKVEAFIRLLQQPRQTEALFDAMLPALQAQLRLVQTLRQQMMALQSEERAALRASPEQKETATLVQSIPGYGERTTPIIVACLPPGWRNWGNKRQIANRVQAYWGCDPRLRESGKWKGQVRMTKRGIEIARTALFQVAVCSLLHEPAMKAFYDRKRAEGQHHLIAVTHVMRKQLRRLIAVLYDRKPFVVQSFDPAFSA